MNLSKDYFDSVRGAVYISANAYNPYQMWRDFSKEEARRDMGFAASINLNALRVWLNYEYWCEKPEALKAAFEDLLDAAAEKGIRIMPSLFEDCGVEPTEEAKNDRGAMTGLDIRSPGVAVTSDPSLWEKPRTFIRWFMENYRDDKRVLAIEVMNEPHINRKKGYENLGFARDMYKTAAEMRGSIPLTIGNIALVHNLYFMEYGLDVLQFHHNFPTNLEEFEQRLEEGVDNQKLLGKPIWISEWQRIRDGGPGWDVSEIPEEHKPPKLASLAPSVHASGLGNFFWSLMLKPAYLPSQRLNGTFNGIFHTDGSVYSLEDARAVSGNPNFNAPERKEYPTII